MFDYLVVGAGFAGAVVAERLAEAGRKVLIVDKRMHIGGNAYDCHDRAGILVHRYGPHIFHTNSRDIFEYLGRFTDWRPYQHRVKACVDGQLLPIPINLNTASDADLLTIPGTDPGVVRAFKEHRPWKTKEQFDKEIGNSLGPKETGRFWRYVVIQ